MDLDDRNETTEGERDGFRPRATDLLRKAVLSGVGALFMTEDGVRSLVKELKLPKEVLSSAMAQADKTKSELVRIVGGELRSFLQSSQVREDLMAMLTELTFEIRAEVAIKPRGETASVLDPPLKSKVTVKRRPAAKRSSKAAPKTEKAAAKPKK